MEKSDWLSWGVSKQPDPDHAPSGSSCSGPLRSCRRGKRQSWNRSWLLRKSNTWIVYLHSDKWGLLSFYYIYYNIIHEGKLSCLIIFLLWTIVICGHFHNIQKGWKNIQKREDTFACRIPATGTGDFGIIIINSRICCIQRHTCFD